MGKKGKRYLPRVQFQVVVEVLKGDRDAVGIACAYDHMHRTTVAHWKREFLKNGANAFGKNSTVAQYEKKMQPRGTLPYRCSVRTTLLKPPQVPMVLPQPLPTGRHIPGTPLVQKERLHLATHVLSRYIPDRLLLAFLLPKPEFVFAPLADRPARSWR